MSDNDSDFGMLYEEGHWTWDDDIGALAFVSDAPVVQEEVIILLSNKAPTGTIEFREDIDIKEQMRFRYRYRRKVKIGDPDVITVQDVKDIALFTAPVNIMSPMLINMLHIPTTERFIRALILYCQYYLQIADVMSKRMKQMAKKVRTPECKVIESQYRENLYDLRILIAKEYCTMITGGNDLKKYHHMGLEKKRSLSDRDAHLFETLIRMCIQIVWLALGRKSFNQIELEVNRLFKTDIYNSAEHTLRTGYISKMSPEERNVLLGQCVRHDKKLNTRSPLVNEIFCHRTIDYRLMGLGVIEYDTLSPTLEFLHRAISTPEHEFKNNGVILGILGRPRSHFDTMLCPLAVQQNDHPRTKSGATQKSASNNVKKGEGNPEVLYPDIKFPAQQDGDEYLPEDFPDKPAVVQPCNTEQRGRWLSRLTRILNSRRSAYSAR